MAFSSTVTDVTVVGNRRLNDVDGQWMAIGR